ncbi:MAG TPA: cytochrome P450 [Thermoleophilaceae bacterium]|nr:cytochrome P450 [Thermoleophilaceae bacterium]
MATVVKSILRTSRTPSAPRAIRLSRRDSLGVAVDVLTPLAARGAIIRRPRVVALEERLDADRRAVRRLRAVRDRYGDGPVLLRMPARDIGLILSGGDARRVLAESPRPFAVANREKRGALSHFQPNGLLVSDGRERAERRRFNEAVLQTGCPLHGLAGPFVSKLEEEAARIAERAWLTGSLGWDDFARGWWRLVRRIVLGDAARDDEELTDLLRSLRKDANWSYLRPTRRRLREQFLRRLDAQLERAEPGSLAELVASAEVPPGLDPHGQVPQWLFAFDAGAMAAFRTLALLSPHRSSLDRALAELSAEPSGAPRELPFLRGCVLESVRLWPTTPVILRDTTEETALNGAVLPAGTALVIFVPYFHRDPEQVPHADRFAPDTWLGQRSAGDWPLMPFSGGPGECPGRDVVLLAASSILAALLGRLELRQAGPRPLRSDRPLPGTLSPFRLRFAAAARR